jgi:hypothetical protein
LAFLLRPLLLLTVLFRLPLLLRPLLLLTVLFHLPLLLLRPLLLLTVLFRLPLLLLRPFLLLTVLFRLPLLLSAILRRVILRPGLLLIFLLVFLLLLIARLLLPRICGSVEPEKQTQNCDAYHSELLHKCALHFAWMRNEKARSTAGQPDVCSCLNFKVGFRKAGRILREIL